MEGPSGWRESVDPGPTDTRTPNGEVEYPEQCARRSDPAEHDHPGQRRDDRYGGRRERPG